MYLSGCGWGSSLGEMLRMQGYTVLQAGDGKQALEVSQEHPGPIHLLITDVVMPQLSGSQLAEAIVSSRGEIKVLYISGYSDEAVRQQGELKSGSSFLQKPASIETVLQRVREILDGTLD